VVFETCLPSNGAKGGEPETWMLDFQMVKNA
jgi:hypothetical protein